MNKIPFNLVFFTTTKGHFDQKDIYQYTINDLENRLGGLTCFSSLYAHVKISPGEEEFFPEMENWLKSKGFLVVSSVGGWKHGEMSHQLQYLADILKVFGLYELHKNQYTFWLEDDFIFEQDGPTILKHFHEASVLLDSPTNFSYRFLRVEDKDFAERTKATLIENNVYKQGCEFSFNPNITRTRDVFLNMLHLVKNIGNLSSHCELAFTQMAQILFPGSEKFLMKSPEIISVKHIGIPNFKQNL